MLILLISPTLRQSSELFRKTRVLLDCVANRSVDVRRTSTEIELANGSSIVSLPGGNPDAIRGYSAPDLIVEDESAFVGDGTFRASRPMLATNPNARHLLLSTPYGRRGHFYELWLGDDPNWRRLMIRSEDCPRISADFLAGEKRVLGERSFEQEYRCTFLESATAVFPSDLIERLVDDNRRRDVLPDAELSRRIRDAKTAAEATELMRQTGMLRADGSVSLDKIQGPAGPLAVLNDEPRKEAIDPEARAEFCRLNNELAELRDERRAVSDRAAKIDALGRRIEALQERTGIADRDDGIDRDMPAEDDGEAVEIDPAAWRNL